MEQIKVLGIIMIIEFIDMFHKYDWKSVQMHVEMFEMSNRQFPLFSNKQARNYFQRN